MIRSPQTTQRRVLLVDDSAIVRQRLAELLAAVPDVVLVGHAEDADSAIALIQERQPDAVILDLGLRSSHGIGVLERLRDITPRPVVVVLTNYPNDEYRRRCLALGADAFLDKSSEFEQVVGAVRAARAPLPDALPHAGPPVCLDKVLGWGPAVLYVLKVEGEALRPVWCAPNIERLTGYRPEETLAPRWHDDRVHPDDRLEVARAIARLRQEGRAEYRYRFLHKDGHWMWLHDELMLVQDAAGQPTEVIGALLNVSERMRAKEDLAQLEREFHQAQKLEAVGRLAGSVAHDFNNVLTAIAGCTELALEALPRDHEARQDLTCARDAVAQGKELARQLLSFSRPQTGGTNVADLNEVLAADQLLLRTAAGKMVRYDHRAGRHVPRVRLGEGQVRQILMNLVINARDAMPEGGTLTITTERVSYDKEAPAPLTPGHYARLIVRDSGVGMDATVQARIFEPFFTTKEQGKGTGLGLASVYGLVTHAGGAIRVSSAPGRGTSFVILLPAGAA